MSRFISVNYAGLIQSGITDEPYNELYRLDGPLTIECDPQYKTKHKSYGHSISSNYFNKSGPSHGDIWHNHGGDYINKKVEAWGASRGIDILDMSEEEILMYNMEVLGE